MDCMKKLSGEMEVEVHKKVTGHSYYRLKDKPKERLILDKKRRKVIEE